jgi:hypothetical protein
VKINGPSGVGVIGGEKIKKIRQAGGIHLSGRVSRWDNGCISIPPPFDRPCRRIAPRAATDIIHMIRVSLFPVGSPPEQLHGVTATAHRQTLYHIRDKIRQQLQVLRDRGFLTQAERGIWQIC